MFGYSTIIEKPVHCFLYLVYNYLVSVLICKFINSHNNFEEP